MEFLKPYYNNNSLAIVYATDNNYVQYLSVAITSLIENSPQSNNYEIYILTEGLNKISVNNLKILAKNHKNIVIQIINIKDKIEELGRELFFESRHIRISAYYRLFIPEIFKNFDKILYLDVDTLVMDDISSIFNLDIGSYPLAVVEDFPLMLKEICSKKSAISRKIYNKEVLGILEHEKYFNSGVILFNIKIIKTDFINKIISAFKIIKNPKYHDQDILNHLYARQAYFLDANWNTQLLNINKSKQFLDKSADYKVYTKILENPKILHFINNIKPWYDPYFPEASYFWQYAKLTPYYEKMLIKIVTEFNMLNMFKHIALYITYKFLLFFVCGKLKRRVKEIVLTEQAKITEIKKFLRSKKKSKL